MRPARTIFFIFFGALFLLASCTECTRAPAPRSPLPPQAPQKPLTPVIDVHTHIGTTAYDKALKLTAQNGVTRIVNLSGGHQRIGLKTHLEAIENNPGRLAVFYNVPWQLFAHPDFPKVLPRAFEEAVRSGYAGLKISKALGLGVTDKGKLIPVDDPRLDPLWAKAGELGVPVAIHTGDPRAFFEPNDQHNERHEELSEAPHWSFADPSYPRRETLLAQRDNVLRKHRNTTFILVHFGNNPEDLDYARTLLEQHPNVVLDISARLAEIGRHNPVAVRKIFETYKDRILFGTDLGIHIRKDGSTSFFLGSLSKEPPTEKDVKTFYQKHWSFLELDHRKTGLIEHPVPIQGRWKIAPISLSPETLKAVYHDNAYRLIFAPWFLRMGVQDPLSTRP